MGAFKVVREHIVKTYAVNEVEAHRHALAYLRLVEAKLGHVVVFDDAAFEALERHLETHARLQRLPR